MLRRALEESCREAGVEDFEAYCPRSAQVLAAGVPTSFGSSSFVWFSLRFPCKMRVPLFFLRSLRVLFGEATA